MPKAIALYSGGLDSTLAILIALRQGIEVTAITFLTPFSCDTSDKSSSSKNPFAVSEKFGFEVKICHLTDKYIEIVINPKYGYGKNMNPCIDCKILMLKEAKQFLKMIGADFVITGEVLYQRPMSQRRDTLFIIEREAGLEGYVLRPLSAKLLKPTIPEQMGIVNRDLLYDFHGRTRKPQIRLAEEFGLTEYPTPAGGCLLTDPIYSQRLKDLFEHSSNPSIKDINLLRIGRHIRLSKRCKVVIGRNEKENQKINELSENDDYLLWVEGFGSPLAIIRGDAEEKDIKLAASILIRYSDAKDLLEAKVAVSKNDKKYFIIAKPVNKTTISSEGIIK